MKDIFHNMSAFIDGVGHIGKAATVRTPRLAMRTEEFIGAGMSTPVDVHLGTEKLEAEVEFNGLMKEGFALFGLAPGIEKPFTFHGAAASSNGDKHGVTIHMRGFVREIDEGDWAPQGKAMTTLRMSLHYYRRLENGVEVLEIDALGGVIKNHGVGQTDWIRERLFL